MMLKALIVEQLESDGTLRSLRMQPATDGGEIVVAFAGEYAEPRHGPFHFLDEEDERRFREGFAKCRARRLGHPNFYRNGRSFHVETSWYGIPTERNWVSYYALSLPEFAIPRRLSITDPHRDGREYRRFVARDDDSRRFIIYLECASSIGRFDFALSCDFEIDETRFATAAYHDPKSAEHGGRGDDWKHWLNESERNKVQQFFSNPNERRDEPRSPRPMARPHQEAARSVHVLIIVIFGVLALACIGGGVLAIIANAHSNTELSILGAQLTTGHVGVAFMGIGVIMAFFTVRAVLRSQRDLAALPPDE